MSSLRINLNPATFAPLKFSTHDYFEETFIKMPKVKTNSGAKKRFKLTASGKIKRKHAFKSHILTKKETKQKRNLTKMTLVHKSDEPRIKNLLNI